MSTLETVLLVLCVAFAVGGCWLSRLRSVLLLQVASAGSRAEVLESRAAAAESLVASLREEKDSLCAQAAALGEQVRGLEASNRRAAEESERQGNVFNKLATDALAANSDHFLKVAKEALRADRAEDAKVAAASQSEVAKLVTPMAASLERVNKQFAEIEKYRTEAYAELKQQVRQSADAHRALREETGRLTRALSKPQVRGRYGEVMLERVVELAGMRSYCDFDTQSTSRDADGSALRPDMVVRLPNGRCVVIDAKMNTEPYMAALESDTPQARDGHLDRFADGVQQQAALLAKKDYAGVVAGSPEFVVMFVPGDQLVDAALERRPELLDFAAQHGVILASPATLIGLLHAVHAGWREKQVSDSAAELLSEGRQLHERAAVVLGHLSSLGKAVGAVAERYNTLVGSVESRLTPTLRRFEERGARSSKSLTDPPRIDVTPRVPRVPGGAQDSQGSQGSLLPGVDASV